MVRRERGGIWERREGLTIVHLVVVTVRAAP